jgi:hypothetical protein
VNENTPPRNSPTIANAERGAEPTLPPTDPLETAPASAQSESEPLLNDDTDSTGKTTNQPGHYSAFDHKRWAEAGLKDFGDFAECVEYVNQSEYGDGQLEGEWYYCDDDTLTVYSGSFGNYNSPGASSYTTADVYDDKTEYEEEKARWEGCPEYLDTDEYEEEDEDCNDDLDEDEEE